MTALYRSRIGFAVMSDLRESLQKATEGRLPGMFGLEIVDVSKGRVDARLELKPEFLAPNDFIHAATVIAIADSAAGMGCIASLPEDAGGFTTIELKTNFLGTAKEGALVCEARMVHGGSRTQVWDSTVRREEDDRVVALFRCTQFILPAEDPRTEQQRRQRAKLEEGK
jgi:1,4-dihydroxy-2-naphthoyl-CoA hydrolase